MLPDKAAAVPRLYADALMARDVARQAEAARFEGGGGAADVDMADTTPLDAVMELSSDDESEPGACDDGEHDGGDEAEGAGSSLFGARSKRPLVSMWAGQLREEVVQERQRSRVAEKEQANLQKQLDGFLLVDLGLDGLDGEAVGACIKVVPELQRHRKLLRSVIKALRAGRLLQGTVHYDYILDSCSNVVKEDPRGHRWSDRVKSVHFAASNQRCAVSALNTLRGPNCAGLGSSSNDVALWNLPGPCERSVHNWGFPRDLLWVLLHNVHVRRRLIHEHPLLGKLLNERATTQDDVESEWSCLVFLAGFKPEVETCLSRLGKADVLAAMRADPELNLHLLTSTKSAYNYNQRAALQVGQPDRWNNGSRMRAAALDAEFAGRMHKAFAQLPGAHCSVRSHHAHGTKQEFS
jgi:hypothetical protein